MTNWNIDKFHVCQDVDELHQGRGGAFGHLEALPSSVASDAYFRQVVESIVDSVVIHQHGRIVFANPSAIEVVGAGLLENLVNQSVLDFVVPEDRQKVVEAISEVMEGDGPSKIFDYIGVSADGRRREVESIAVKVASLKGDATLNVCRDVTDRNRIKRALKDSEALFQTFREHSAEATIAICEQRIVLANRAMVQLFGVDGAEELLGQSVFQFCDESLRSWAKRSLAIMEKGKAVTKQMRGRLYRPDGIAIDAEWTSIPFTFGGKPAVYLILNDITERLRSEENHRFLASHDALTGLPNRLEFERCLKSIVMEARASGTSFAIHYIDLDYFKTINDTLGHHIGDELLQKVATRLKHAVRASDVVARLGGDEFAVLQRGVVQMNAATELAMKLQKAIEQPYSIGDELLHTSITIGIALFPDHGDAPEILLRRADLALYRAKGRGRNAISFFSDDLDVQVRERDSLITQLVRAEAEGEFDLFFQPIANLCTGRIDAVEALLRWNHPERGLLPAEAFIHAIEASREAQRIGAWVLRKACEYAKTWERENLVDLRIAVNLSMPLLQRPDLVDLVTSCLADVGLDPGRLELELTERMVITSGVSGIEQKLAKLRKLGVHIALDDFGTGFSSLSLLKDLPIDRIKIDRSFVAGFGTNADDTAIVRAVTNLGRSMNKRVTAEGVETSEKLELLRSEGCHEIQGYHLAKPMPATDIAKFLKTYCKRTPVPVG